MSSCLCATEHAKAGAARLAAAQHSAQGALSEQQGPPRHPDLLSLFGRALLSPQDWPRARLEELLYHAYGAPWLQALLMALQGDMCASLCLAVNPVTGSRRVAGRRWL